MSTTQPPQPPSPTRRRLRSIAIPIALGLALAVAVGVASLAWLQRSDHASTWALQQLPGLSASGVSGRWQGGPFAAERIEWRWGARTLVLQGVAWQDAQWSWRPHDGAWIGVVLLAPTVERATLLGTGSDQPLVRPDTLRLPVALTLRQARIGTLQLEGVAPITQLSGSVMLGANAGAEHRVADLRLRFDRAVIEASGRISADAPFDSELKADARSQDEAVPAWRASLGTRGPLDKLALQARLGSDQAPGATLRAEASVLPFAAWPLAALSAAASDLDLAALSSALPRTRISGQADIDSSGLQAPVTARVVLSNPAAGRWDQQRLPIAGLDVELAGQMRDRSRLSIRRFALLLPPGAGRIEGSGEWQAATAQLALRLQDVKPDLLDGRAAAMALSGQATLSLQGLPAPDGSKPAAASQRLQVRADVAGRLQARSNLPVQVSGRAEGERSATGWQVELSDLLLRSGEARLKGGLTAARSSTTAWQVRSRGELSRFDPSVWIAGPADSGWRRGPHRLAGRWRADLQGGAAPAAGADPETRLLAMRGEAEVTLQDSQLAGVPLQGQVRLDGRTPGWAVNADLRAGGNRANLQGRLAPRAQDDRWQLELDAPKLAELQALGALLPALAGAAPSLGADLRRPLSGQLSGQVRGQGRWPQMAFDADLRAAGLQAAGLRAARLQLTAQASPQLDAALALQLGGEQLSFDGMRLDSLQARIDGSLAEHRYTLDLQSPLRLPAWTDALTGGAPRGTRLRARGAGQWSAATPHQALLPGRWRSQALELDAGDPAGVATAAPWLRARDLRLQMQWGADGQLLAASAEPGRLEALGAALRWSEAGWRAGAPGAPAEASLDAQLEPLAVVAWLTRLRPAAGLSGDLVLGGRARVKIGQRMSADVVVERSSGDLALTDDTGTQPFGLSDLRLAVAAQDGTWHFTQALAGSNMGVLAGAVSLRLPAEARWPRPDTPMQGVLEWQVADLGAWAPFTPPGWRLSGALRTGASIGGSFGAPEITGELTGSRLALRNLLEGVDVRDGELALSLRGSEARVDRFVFKGGNGELRLTGGASLGAEPSARLQLTAERFQVLGRLDRRLVGSGTASLVLAPKTLTLDGRLRIDEGLFDVSRSDAPTLDSDVQVRGGRAAPPTPPATPTPTRADPAAAGTVPRNTRVALQIDLGSDLKLRGRGLDTLLRGELTVSTPSGRLAVTGNVRTEAGSYAAYGQKLAIERGVLSFNGAANNPRLDILALRPNLDLRVGVQVSGSVQQPRVRLFSEPEMSDTDKLSWLVLGRAPDGLGRTDTALLQRAALALLAGEGEGLNKTLLANIGLDEFSVRQIETGDVRDTVVTLGKQLSRRWYVGYERGVNSTTGTWQLIYRAAQRFTVRAQAGEDNALDAIWTWRWN